MKKRVTPRYRSNALQVKEEAVIHPTDNLKVDGLTTGEMQSLLREMQKRQADLEERCHRLSQVEKDIRDKYTDLLSSVPIGLVTLDSSNVILETNPCFSDLLQLEPPQLLDTDFSSLVAENDKEVYKKFFKKLLRSAGKHSTNLNLLNKSNNEIEVRLQGHRNVTSKGSLYLQLAVSAAAGRQANDAKKPDKNEEKLKQLDMLLRESQAIAHVGSFRYDLENDVLQWSDEMYRIHGLEPGDIQPSLLYLIKHTFVDDQIQVRETLFRAFRNKIPFSLTRRFLRPDGRMSYIHVTGKFLQEGDKLMLIGTAQDVTEAKKVEEQIKQKNEELLIANRKLRTEIEGRQRVEEALIESEEKWRTLVENTPDGVVRFDPEMRHLFVNKAVEQLTGISADELIGKTYQESSLTQEVDNVYFDTVREVFRTGRQAHCYNFYETTGGRKYYFSIAVPEFGLNGKVKSVLTISRDITETKQKENLLNGVLNSSIHGIAAISAIRDEEQQIKDFEWLLVNKAAEALLQRNAKGIIGKTVLDIVPGHKECGLFDEFVHTVETGETLNRVIYYNYEHSKSWYQVVAVKLEDGLVFTFADISEYKMTEERLRRREAELLEAQEVGHLGSWSYNLKTGEFTCSKELEHILELPEDCLTTLGSFIEYIHPQDRSHMEELISRAIVELQPFSREYRLVKPDGSIRWISGRGKIIYDEEGIPLRLASTGQDITDLKEAEQQVRREKELNESIIEHIMDGISAFDKEGTYTTWNKALEAYTSLKKEDVIGRKIFDVFPYIQHAPVGQKFRDVLQGKYGKVEKAAFLVRNGFYEAHFVPTFDANKQLTGGLCIIHDITESLKLKELSIAQELSQQHAVLNAVLEAQEAERKRIAESLHNGVGQLLYGIKLHLEQLNTSTDERRKELEHQEVNALLEEAIREIRTLSFELTPSVLEDFGLEIALKELCKKLSSANLQLKLNKYTCHQRLTNSVEIAVYRILQELINNVIRHAHATVAQIKVSCSANELTFGVSDNGIGFILRNSLLRKGIGLKSIENRLKLLNGSMDIDSGKSKGTSITIKVPLLPAERQRKTAKKQK